MPAHASALRCVSLLVCFLLVTLWGSSFALLLPVRADAPFGVCQSGSTPLLIGNDCAPGFFCPGLNTSDARTFPALCSPSLSCSVTRLAGDFCDVQGTYEPLVCGRGKYCPTPAEQMECPEEHFCPLGTVHPHPCPVMSLCGTGSETPFYYGSLIAVLITDLALLAILYGYRAWYKRALQKRDEHYKVIQRSSQKHTEFDAEAPVQALPPHIQLLCAGFRRARQSLPPMLLEFESLSLRIPGVAGQPYRTILAGVTGSLMPGKVTAVLGPSGAGKTTFLNCLQGKVESNWQRAGLLRVNGEEQELRRFAKVRGFVPQEDTMHRDLSVYDNIRYSARMRLPSDWTAAEIEDHVNACILAVQLGGVQDGRIGDEHTRGVSGGQRKRCNIAMEVASAPTLLLLDEPTSGLDSTAAMEICRMLKDLARACQLTVVQVIHQPRVEIWDSLDEVLLLAPGGLTCYQGPQRLAVSYFKRTVAGLTLRPQDNPTDVLTDLIAEQGTLLVTLWKERGRERLLQIKLDAKAAAASSNKEREAHARSEAAKTLSSAVATALSPEGAHSPQQAVLSPSAPVAEDDADHLIICPPSSSATVVRATAAAVTFDLSVGGGGSTRALDGDPTTGQHVTIDVQRSFPHPEQSVSPPTATVAADAEEDEISTIPLSPLAFMKNDDSPPKGTRGETLARYWTSFVGQPAFPPADVPLRQTAWFLTQVWLSLARSLRKQSLNPVALLIEVTLGMLAGVVMGVSGSGTYQGVLVQPYTPLSPAPFESAVPQLGMLVSMAVGISAASAGARVFGGDEQIVYWREAAAGHGKLAYFIGNSLAQLPRNFLCGLHFALSYHILATPVMLFSDFLPVSILLFYAVYGLGCLVSMLVARTNAALVSVVSALISAVFCGYVRQLPFVLKVLAPAYWATEAFFDKNTEPFQHIMQVAECSAPTWGYRLGWFANDLALIFAVGTGYRVLAFVAMVTQHRSKQK